MKKKIAFFFVTFCKNIRNFFQQNYSGRNFFMMITFILAFIGIIGGFFFLSCNQKFLKYFFKVGTILGVLLHPGIASPRKQTFFQERNIIQKNKKKAGPRFMRATYFYSNSSCEGFPLEIVARPYVVENDPRLDPCHTESSCIRSLDSFQIIF